MRGDLGQPPGGWPEALQKKVLKGETPITVRPGSLLPPADLDAEREARRGEDRHAARRPRARLLPHVSEGLHRLRQGRRTPTARSSVLPTPVYFYGLPVGEEILVEIEKGKTLVVRMPGDRRDRRGGRWCRVFFELNGQPRIVKVPNRAARRQAAGAAARPRRATRAMSPRRCRAWSRRSPSRPARRSRPATCSSRSRR